MFNFLKKNQENQNTKINIEAVRVAQAGLQSEAKPNSRPASDPKAPLINPNKKPAGSKKTFVLVGVIVGLLFAIYLAFAFITVGMAEEGKDFTVSKMFGMQSASFLNFLVTGVHLVIAAIAFMIFILIMISLLKMLLAKKEDVEKKKKAQKKLVIFGIIFGVILVAWITAFVYLEGRREALKINIEYPPIVTEPANTLQLSAPITIKFDASHSPMDSDKFQVLSYDWDFGDAKLGTGKVVTHDFVKKGRFDVILTITKRDKTTEEETKDTYSQTVTIADQALTASFTADPQSGEAPLKVKFDASDSVDPDGKIATYEWDLNGDGEFEKDSINKVQTEYTYEKIGNYDATLRVTSMTGDYAVAKKQIIIGTGETPQGVIEVQDNPEVFEKGVTYIFKGGSSTSPNGLITGYEWDFGDGSQTETTKTVAHKFKDEGSYDVVLKVTDEKEKMGETTRKIVVGKKPGMPQAVIKTTPALAVGALALQGEMPFSVEFDGSTSTDSKNDIVDYQWDFNGDNKADEFGKKVTHSFNEEGTYTVKLIVVDAEDNENETTIGIKVTPQGIKAALNVTPLNGEVPLTVNFDASGSYYPNGSISSYKWDFGDKTSPVLGSAKISHKYTSIGEYKATVTVIGSDNSKDTAEANIVVRAVQLSACFKAKPLSGKAPLAVTFEPDCSTGSITTYNLNFGDSGISSDVKPSHTFTNPGLYTVTLEVLDNNNTVSNTTVEIEVQP